MRRYSPSQTETWLRCPRLRAIRAQGWEPTRLGKPGLARILGTAFAAGVGAYNMMRQSGATPDAGACGEIAAAMAVQHLQEADAAGLVTGDGDTAQRAALPERARKFLLGYAAHDPIPPSWTILDVELTLDDWGRARIDLGYENDLGVGVLDYKTKLTLDARYFDKEVARYKTSEQRLFYPAAYGAYLDRPVHRFDILLVIGEPRFRTHLIPFMVNPTLQADWLRSRETTWALMEATEPGGEIEPWMAADHHTAFGPCDYLSYCFDLKGDPALAATSGTYTNRKKEFNA